MKKSIKRSKNLKRIARLASVALPVMVLSAVISPQKAESMSLLRGFGNSLTRFSSALSSLCQRLKTEGDKLQLNWGPFTWPKGSSSSRRSSTSSNGSGEVSPYAHVGQGTNGQVTITTQSGGGLGSDITKQPLKKYGDPGVDATGHYKGPDGDSIYATPLKGAGYGTTGQRQTKF